MSLMTVRDALDWLNAAAPFDTAEDFDNVGLLIGDERLPVQNVIFGLDATPALVREAVRLHAQLIVTHHPLLFHPLRRIHYADPIGQAVSEIVENRMSLIAAHTNWDKAEGGVSDSLASLLELKEIRRADDYLRIGRLPSPMSPEAFCAFAGEKLGLSPRLYGRGEDQITWVAAAGGAYGEAEAAAAPAGAQAFVVGEIHHHEIIDAAARGLWVLDSGHHATEQPGIAALYHRFLRDASQAGWAVQARLIDTAPFPKEPVR